MIQTQTMQKKVASSVSEPSLADEEFLAELRRGFEDIIHGRVRRVR